MKKLKHTSGPWKIINQDIYGNEPNGYICRWSGNSNDAHLIAAAPEMLEALIELATEKNMKYLLQPIIEKATGLKIDEVIKENE